MERLLKDLNVSTPQPLKLYSDHKSAIAITHNPVLHDRTKHIEINKHFIKEILESGQICIPYLPTVEQEVVCLTKGLPKNHFDRLVSKLGMKDIFKPAWEGVLETESLDSMNSGVDHK